MAVELSLRCQMCDLHFNFEEDRTKTAVAIEDDRYFGQRDRQTDRHTYIHTLKWFYICPMPCTHCIGQTITGWIYQDYHVGLLRFFSCLTIAPSSGSCRNIHLKGDIPGGLRDGSASVGSRGEAPERVWGTSSKNWNSLQTLFTDFDDRNDQNLKISHNPPPGSWPVCFTVGLSDIWEGDLALSPCRMPPLALSRKGNRLGFTYDK